MKKVTFKSQLVINQNISEKVNLKIKSMTIWNKGRLKIIINATVKNKNMKTSREDQIKINNLYREEMIIDIKRLTRKEVKEEEEEIFIMLMKKG
jgi:hypothetical protein